MQTYPTLVSHPMLWVFVGLLAGFYLILWATSLNVRRLPPRSVWLRRNYPAVILTGVAALAIVALTFYLIEIGISVRVLVDRLRLTAADPASDVSDLQSLASAVAILIGVLAAAATILYSSIRVWINERTATATEEGLITDRINKAVQGLGAEKTVNRLGRTVRYTIEGVDGSYFEWIDDQRAPPSNPDVVDGKVKLTNDPWSSFPNTQPNLEVRIGAVYALERIAQDSARDHVQIMEILCAYVRQNAPFNPEHTIPEDWEAAWDDAVDADWDDDDIAMPNAEVIRDWALGCDRPREDVQVALTVIGRRSPAQIALEGHKTPDGDWVGYRLDLRRTCLQRVDLARANLAHAQFDGAQTQGADLSGAQMQKVQLSGAQMQGTRFWEAKMQGANLSGTQMQGANLWAAQMRGAHLRETLMQRANLAEADLQGALFSRAQMQGAHLYQAKMQGANLGGSQMNGTDVTEANLQGANLDAARMQGADLTKAQLQRTYLRGAQMQRALLTEAKLQGARLNGAQMQMVNLYEAHLQGANFYEAQMQGAHLSGAQMARSTNFNRADLRGVPLRLVDLSDVAFTQYQIDSLFGDQTVILPEGLTRPEWPEVNEHDWNRFFDQWHAWLKKIGFDPDDPKTW